MKKLYEEKTIISNCIQCETWSLQLVNHKNKFVIPILVNQDDLEPGNDKGSHASHKKLGALHASIPCFPAHLSSRLENIVLTILSYAKDRKTATVEKMYSQFIDELNELSEEGLLVNIDNR